MASLSCSYAQIGGPVTSARIQSGFRREVGIKPRYTTGMQLRKLSSIFLLLVVCLASAKDTRIKDVIYQTRGGFALTMDVFEPATPNGGAVIWLVSGGYSSNRDQINPMLADIFTKRGLTVFEVVHGSAPKFQVPEITQDLQRAVRFIRHNASLYGVNPNRIGISGASSGGQLSLMTAMLGKPGPAEAKDVVDRESSEINAVAVFFPPTDMLNWGKEGVSTFEVPMLQIFWPAFGVTKQSDPIAVKELARTLSPIYGVTAKFPPTLLIHGDKDPLVPLQQSQRFDAKLTENGVVHKLIVVPGVGHGWKDMMPQFAQIAEWLDEKLKK